MENIMQNDIVKPENFDEIAYDLILKLCEKDPDDRLTDPELIK
jgi:serine/threonine protein kinase